MVTVKLKFINANQLEARKDKVSDFMMNKFSISHSYYPSDVTAENSWGKY